MKTSHIVMLSAPSPSYLLAQRGQRGYDQLIAEYDGSYSCLQGPTGLHLRVFSGSDATHRKVVFQFGPTSANERASNALPAQWLEIFRRGMTQALQAVPQPRPATREYVNRPPLDVEHICHVSPCAASAVTVLMASSNSGCSP
jgi:hypothetical protein